MTKEPDSEPVIKLPRGRGLRLSGPELFRIALTLAMLIAIAMLTKPCSNAVSTFVMGMDGSEQEPAVPKPGMVEPGQDSPEAAVHRGDAGAIEPPPLSPESAATPSGPSGAADDLRAPAQATDRFEHLRPEMTEAEVRSAIERAKAKAAPPPK